MESQQEKAEKCSSNSRYSLVIISLLLEVGDEDLNPLKQERFNSRPGELRGVEVMAAFDSLRLVNHLTDYV